MKILGYQPNRRRLLRSLGLALLGAPLVKIGGRALDRQARRRRRDDDLAPVPWIGHC